MKKINALLVLLALILAGCSGNNSNPASSEITNKVPIAFYKSEVTLSKQLNVIENNDTHPDVDVELGTIRGNETYIFKIENTGTSAITGLKFEFDSTFFKVTPDTIIALGAPSNNTSISALIKVTVEHGKKASGYGFANVLTGHQYGTLKISGRNDDGEFSVSYTMHVYAKRMIITIDVPDTVAYSNLWWTSDPNSDKFSTELRGFRYIHVDPSSDDCYLNMGGIELDTSYNLVMRNMTKYYAGFGYDPTQDYSIEYNYDMGTPIDSTMSHDNHMKFFTELNAAKRIESSNSYDNNCVVLVNDNWPLTNQSQVPKYWEKTQRILN